MQRRISPPFLLAAGYALLAIAWAMANPPFLAPDEDAHYRRALGVADGHLVGRVAAYHDAALTPVQAAWAAQTARAVRVPAGLSPTGYGCPVGHPRRSAACQKALRPARRGAWEVTPVGTYEPLPYLLPAAAVSIAQTPASGDRLGRLATVLPWLALVALAAFALWSAEAVGPLLGLLLAVTPTTVFIGASLTGSGLEIGASIAFAAVLLRLVRDDRPLGCLWAAAATSGAVLALSRSLGPAWVLIDVAVVAALAGPGRLREIVRVKPIAASVVGATLSAAVALSLAWEAIYGPRVSIGLDPLQASIGAGRRQLGEALLQAVGSFGYNEVHLPAAPSIVWGAMLAMLVAVAWRAAATRERRVLGVTIAVALVFPVLFFAAVTRHSGFPLQGRHVLPVLVLVPLLAGEVIHRHRRRLQARLLAAAGLATAAGVSAVQLTAWYVDAHRAAVGTRGPWWFAHAASWSPPAGWFTWLFVAALGAIALAAAGPMVTVAHAPQTSPASTDIRLRRMRS